MKPGANGRVFLEPETVEMVEPDWIDSLNDYVVIAFCFASPVLLWLGAAFVSEHVIITLMGT